MNKCTCKRCKACGGAGWIKQDDNYLDPDEYECPVCWGDGLSHLCDYCKEKDFNYVEEED